MANKYFQIFIVELKNRPFQEGDGLYNVWSLLVQDYSSFDKRKYRTERGANMAVRRIKKYFPDIPLEVESFLDIKVSR